MENLPPEVREEILIRVVASEPFVGSDEGWKNQHGANWRKEKRNYIAKMKRWRRRFLRKHSLIKI